ncbi:MAG: succinate dehydrogenase iron-sulfur subunit [Candidatus Bathyarchaeota archaeon]|nr:succinate dehydrogenase iron-sulfur subunit [Candidatus Bathyarchaeota archaeon]
MEVRFKIFRLDPDRGEAPHYDAFTVDADPDERVLDCLNRIRWEQDPSLAYRWSCSHGICGSDGVTINGQATLACQKLVRDLDLAEEVLIEPLQFFPVIKDLVVDVEPFFRRLREIHPEGGMRLNLVEFVEELKQTAEERAQYEDAIRCVMCGCCTASCPVNLEEDAEFIGPAATLRAHRYIFDSRAEDALERLEVMNRPHGIWSCKTYYRCTEVCPRNIKVTEAILKTKGKILDARSS